jgi:6-phosphogluconate dehydrogenase
MKHVGMIGIGNMQQPVVSRLLQQGYVVSLYAPFATTAGEQGIAHYNTIDGTIDSLPFPRTIFYLTDAAAQHDELIETVFQHVRPGDILIDISNAHYEDTTHHFQQLQLQGTHFLGCGIAGGIEGASLGFSVMAGGSRLAYDMAIDVLQALAARAVDNSPCCAFVGEGGAGHFVKMVHNGLEYAEMELLAEVYSLLRWAVGLSPAMIADVLSNWKSTEANGYLLEITLNILREQSGNTYVIDRILDSAGHKGTGVWAVQAAASFGVPAMMITASLHARFLTAQRHIREHLNDIAASHPKKGASVSTNDVFKAFQLSRFINYHEGFAILRAASSHYGWHINLSDLSTIWTNGCIIRSALMNQFILLWKNWDDELILHPEVKQIIASDWSGLRRIIQVASGETIFTPCLVAASQYIAGASLHYPMANLIQAQRDYFGNDGFGTIDDPNAVHHYPWNRT